MKMSRILLTIAVILAIYVSPALAQMRFKKVELRNAFGNAAQGRKGRLVIDGKKIEFQSKRGRAYFSIPTSAVQDVFYSRVSGRRIGAAIAITPFLLFSKGRKHYMTLTFNDGEEMVGAVEFRLHKGNYRSCLRSVEQVTGLTMGYDQEGIKDSQQEVSKRKEGSKEGKKETRNPKDGVD